MRDLIDLARIGWQHDKGGLFAVLLGFAFVGLLYAL